MRKPGGSCWAAASLAGLLTLAAASANAAPDPLEPARTAWVQALYRVAFLHVADLSTAQRLRPEAMYIQGTSACRIARTQNNGRTFLTALAARKDIGPAWRPVALGELTKCGQATPPQPFSHEANLPASMSINAKTFYWLDRKSAPVSRPIAVSAVKDEDLLARRRPAGDAEAGEIAKAQLEGCTLIRTRRLAVCSTAHHTPAELTRIAEAIDRHILWLKAAFGLEPPPHTLYVYLVPSVGAINAFAARSHGIEIAYGTIGYALDKDQSVVAVATGEAYGTVLHEITHLVMSASFPGAPEWLEEGLASLYETSKSCGGVMLGAPNWRGQVLQQAWAHEVKLDDALRAPWYRYQSRDADSPDTRLAAEYYSLARYLMLYLQDEGLLAETVRQMKAETAADLDRAQDLERPLAAAPADAGERSAALLTRLTGGPLPAAELKVRALVPVQTLERVPRWANQAATAAGLAPCRDLAEATDIKKSLEVQE